MAFLYTQRQRYLAFIIIAFCMLILAAQMAPGQQSSPLPEYRRLLTRTFVPTSYDYASFFSVYPTADGGCVATGLLGDVYSLTWDAALVKFDSIGEMEWAYGIGRDNFNSAPAAPSYDDIGYDVIQTADGGYALGGTTKLNGERDMLLLKTDANGTPLWGRRYYGCIHSIAYSIRQTADGGFLLGGVSNCDSFDINATPKRNRAILKTDSVGNVEWSTTLGHDYGGPEFRAFSLADGNYVLYGTNRNVEVGVNIFPHEYNAQALVLSPTGELQWGRSYGTGANTTANGACPTPDGGMLVVGEAFDQGEKDMCALRLDATGTVVWAAHYDLGGEDYAQDVIPIENGFMVWAYRNMEESPGPALVMLELDTQGGVVRQQAYSPTDPADPNVESVVVKPSRLARTRDGGFLAMAYNNALDILMKTNRQAEAGCGALPVVTAVRTPVDVATQMKTFTLDTVTMEPWAVMQPLPLEEIAYLDFASSAECGPVSSVPGELQGAHMALVYPNPVAQGGAIRVDIPAITSNDIALYFYTTSGALAWATVAAPIAAPGGIQAELPALPLASGLYTLRIVAGGAVSTTKFIVE